MMVLWYGQGDRGQVLWRLSDMLKMVRVTHVGNRLQSMQLHPAVVLAFQWNRLAAKEFRWFYCVELKQKINCMATIKFHVSLASNTKREREKNIRKKTLHAIQWQIKDPNVLTNDMPIRNPLSFYSEHMSPGSFIMYMQKARTIAKKKCNEKKQWPQL